MNPRYTFTQNYRLNRITKFYFVESHHLRNDVCVYALCLAKRQKLQNRMTAATPARVKRYRCHFTACVVCCAQSDRGSIRLTLNDYFAKICHAEANDGKLEALLLLLLPPSLLLLLLCALSRSSHHPIEAKSLYYFYCVPEKWRRENPLESLVCRSVCVCSVSTERRVLNKHIKCVGAHIQFSILRNRGVFLIHSFSRAHAL